MRKELMMFKMKIKLSSVQTAGMKFQQQKQQCIIFSVTEIQQNAKCVVKSFSKLKRKNI